MIVPFSDATDFTCVINVRNGEEYISEAIQSVQEQSLPVKLLIVDNQSTDLTADLVKKTPHLRYEKTPSSMKLSEARNYSLNFIDTEFVSWLDADDLWLPNFCEESRKALLKNKDAGFLSSCTILIDEKGMELPENKQRMQKRGGETIQEGDTLEKIFDKLRCAASWQSYVFRTELVKKIGGFHLQYTYSADLDLISRLLLESKCLHIDENLSKCRIHPQQMTKTFSPKIRFDETKNILVNVAKKTEGFQEASKLKKLLEIIDFRSHLACFMELKSMNHAFKAFALLRKPHVSQWLSKRILSRSSY